MGGKKGIFEFLDLCGCLLIDAPGKVATFALLLELEHKWGRAGSG